MGKEKLTKKLSYMLTHWNLVTHSHLKIDKDGCEEEVSMELITPGSELHREFTKVGWHV